MTFILKPMVHPNASVYTKQAEMNLSAGIFSEKMKTYFVTSCKLNSLVIMQKTYY